MVEGRGRRQSDWTDRAVNLFLGQVGTHGFVPQTRLRGLSRKQPPDRSPFVNNLKATPITPSDGSSLQSCFKAGETIASLNPTIEIRKLSKIQFRFKMPPQISGTWVYTLRLTSICIHIPQTINLSGRWIYQSPQCLLSFPWPKLRLS